MPLAKHPAASDEWGLLCHSDGHSDGFGDSHSKGLRGSQGIARRRIRLTPEGVVFLIILGFISFGAILRNVNLLVILAGMMVSAILLNWRSAKLKARTITGFRELPQRGYAGKLFSIVWRIQNQSPQRIWNIIVDDHVRATPPPAKIKTDANLGLIARIRQQILKSSKRSNPGEVRVSFPQVSPQSSESNLYHCLLVKRGEYHVGPSTISTTFPFGLIRVELTLNNEEVFYASPPMGKLIPDWERHAAEMTAGPESVKRKRGARDDEFFALRQWRPGDNRRNIHWRSTARMQHPMVRQFDEPTDRDLAIVIDLHHPKETDGWQPHDAGHHANLCETVLSFASTTTTHSDDTTDGRTSIAICGQENEVFLKFQRRKYNADLIRCLAMAQSNDDPNLFSAITTVGGSVSHGTPIYIVSTRSQPHWLEQMQKQTQKQKQIDSPPEDIYRQPVDNVLDTLAWPNKSLGRLHQQIRWIDAGSDEFRKLFTPPTEIGPSATEEAHMVQLNQRWG